MQSYCTTGYRLEYLYGDKFEIFVDDTHCAYEQEFDLDFSDKYISTTKIRFTFALCVDLVGMLTPNEVHRDVRVDEVTSRPRQVIPPRFSQRPASVSASIVSTSTSRPRARGWPPCEWRPAWPRHPRRISYSAARQRLARPLGHRQPGRLRRYARSFRAQPRPDHHLQSLTHASSITYYWRTASSWGSPAPSCPCGEPNSASRSRNGSGGNASGPSTPAPFQTPSIEQLQRDDRVDRRLPDDRLAAVLAHRRLVVDHVVEVGRARLPVVAGAGHPRAGAGASGHALAERRRVGQRGGDHVARGHLLRRARDTGSVESRPSLCSVLQHVDELLAEPVLERDALAVDPARDQHDLLVLDVDALDLADPLGERRTSRARRTARSCRSRARAPRSAAGSGTPRSSSRSRTSARSHSPRRRGRRRRARRLRRCSRTARRRRSGRRRPTGRARRRSRRARAGPPAPTARERASW